MPIWLRRYTYQEIFEHYEEQNKQNSNTNTPNKQIARPDIRPDYITKAST
jgi:hypothetical protein